MVSAADEEDRDPLQIVSTMREQCQFVPGKWHALLAQEWQRILGGVRGRTELV